MKRSHDPRASRAASRGGDPSQVPGSDQDGSIARTAPTIRASGWTERRAKEWTRRRIDAGYLIGDRSCVRSSRFGFAGADRGAGGGRSPGRLRRVKGEFHGCVLGASGTGKGVCSLIPAALMHAGQFICVDPRGEIAQVTARRRREMGDQVVIIDPFGELGPDSQGINPLDLLAALDLSVDGIGDLAETLSCELGAGHEGKDMFWWNTATALLSGAIAFAAGQPDPERRTLKTALEILSDDDTTYRIAVLLDTHGASMLPLARRRLAEFLEIPDSSSAATRGCVLVSARQMLHCLEAPRVLRTLSQSSVDLRALVDGEAPLSVYLVFPPSRVKSHRGLLRLWLSTLTQCLLARRTIPKRRTLLLIDEAANIGRCDLLPLLYSYGRGFGVSCLTAWQSLGQMSDVYPGGEWRVILENSIVQAFGLHPTAVPPLAALLGIAPDALHRMGTDEQIVARAGLPPEIVSRVDYRRHPLLAAMADPNPRYRRSEATKSRPANPSR